ncbi:MAG: T9SS type A sorting domain-containing protein [candidate division WOR-3 bacterium]|nr:T9SS type A sorting domain-containing protein [candidate division WOR-3 bacterium]MCX7836867.1 T9SS type A sorting domain-containing protein [candidate division WOR-3 bacterium]MDW8114331.1 T9SS type A sorting domain-containing protein [candidate division WOR-3 bacterium]
MNLQYPDPNIILIDSVKNFGNILPQDSAFTGNQGYRFRVANSCTNGYRINFILRCKDALDSTWLSSIYLRVGTPLFRTGVVYAFDTPPGNNNRRLDPGEECAISIQLRNIGYGNGYNIYAVLKSADTSLRIIDSIGIYGNISTGDSSINLSNTYYVYASPRIIPETPIPCTLKIYGDNFLQVLPFAITVGELRPCDPVTDGFYWIYENIDTFYSECPNYEWVEIRNLGINLNLGDDETRVINLPTSFGLLKYYNTYYNQISICSNGWAAIGYTTIADYFNTPLPSQIPNQLACSWDDYYPPTGGGVWYYFDSLNHRLIIEWDSVHYFSPREQWDKFQIIIYDTTIGTINGNNVILFQYYSNNYYLSNTVGFQNLNGTSFINILYNTQLSRGFDSLRSRRAIKITPNPPQVSINEEPNKETIRKTIILKGEKIKFYSEKDKEYNYSIYNLNGQLVKKGREYLKKGWQTIKLDKKLPKGVYLLFLKTINEKTHKFKILIFE